MTGGVNSGTETEFITGVNSGTETEFITSGNSVSVPELCLPNSAYRISVQRGREIRSPSLIFA